jgi:hypothetical protein
MPTKVEQDIFERIKDLSPEQQHEVLRLVELLAKKDEESLAARLSAQEQSVERLEQMPEQPEKTIWEEIREISADVPDEVWERLPRDGAVNVDHYLYGAPKK